MRVIEQTTLFKSGAAEGVGLHSGVVSRIALRPATAGTGVLFRRTDLKDETGARVRGAAAAIAAWPGAVAEARRGVTLRNAAGASVMTVEHLLAALAIAGVDNVNIDVCGPEIPILDGSAAPFLQLIAECGVACLSEPRQAIDIVEVLREECGDRFVQIEPCDRRLIELSIDFADAAIGRQEITLSLDDPEETARRAGAARTFCTAGDIAALRTAGLGLGGSLSCTLVVDGPRILNDGGLRDPAEFALHKALDLIGDLSLVGAPIFGRIVAHKPGHDLNTRLARRIYEAGAGRRRTLVPERLTA